MSQEKINFNFSGTSNGQIAVGSHISQVRQAAQQNKHQDEKKILILLANPVNANRLFLEREVREIKACLRQADERESYLICTAEATRPNDLQGVFLEHRPNIVHFSGHAQGNSSGKDIAKRGDVAPQRHILMEDDVYPQKNGATDGLAFEDDRGLVKLVSAEALSGLFEAFADTVECVLLNACYSSYQAQAIANHINTVIGMRQPINDQAAIAFSTGFYEGLGAGCNYEMAYRLGCNRISICGLPGEHTPQILQKQL